MPNYNTHTPQTHTTPHIHPHTHLNHHAWHTVLPWYSLTQPTHRPKGIVVSFGGLHLPPHPSYSAMDFMAGFPEMIEDDNGDMRCQAHLKEYCHVCCCDHRGMNALVSVSLSLQSATWCDRTNRYTNMFFPVQFNHEVYVLTYQTRDRRWEWRLAMSRSFEKRVKRKKTLGKTNNEMGRNETKSKCKETQLKRYSVRWSNTLCSFWFYA